MSYTQFEQMPAWKQVRVLVKDIYRICDRISFKNDYDLLSQIRRAGTSILLSISEGFERRTNKDFARFINQAKASSGELRCALNIALVIGYLNEKFFIELKNESISISNQLAKFEQY